MNIALWIVQGVLAALFLFGGYAKLTMPLEEMVAMTGLPGLFIQVIAVAELLGAVGLILPQLLRIKAGLTPLAALGLAIITAGATVINLASPDPITALFPLSPCVFSAIVAYGRWTLNAGSQPRQQEPTLLRAA
jgi:hypothetical protein